MEIVAVTFDSAFRKKLYPQVTLFQEADCATGRFVLCPATSRMAYSCCGGV